MCIRDRDMKADPEQRAVQLGEYIAAHNATVRAAAAAFISQELEQAKAAKPAQPEVVEAPSLP